MPKVKRLPDYIANQIAAGEVVERPSSVVKELVENSLDAGATSIEVNLSKGGKRLVEVKDNGEGMSRHDLELCVEPHATSKIESQDDLECISTLGFRGEALASIGAVSKLSITSRQSGASDGWKVEVCWGKRLDVRPQACSPGTMVRVEDLFMKIPARAKFLKSDQTEYARCMKMIYLFCASWPDVGFKVNKEGKNVFLCRPDQPISRRIEPLVGKKVVHHMVEVEHEGPGLALSGFVARPDQVKLSARHVYFFLNRRPVSSPVLWKALNDALKGFLVKGNHVAGVFFIDIDPVLVDVNVHPTKSEVRFERPGDIYRLLFHGVRRALETDAKTVVLKQDIFEPSGEPSSTGMNDIESDPDIEKPSQVNIDFPLPWENVQGKQRDGRYLADKVENKEEIGAPSLLEVQEPVRTSSYADTKGVQFEFIGQFAGTFLLFERCEKLFIVDQHAAHEALLFQRISSELESSGYLRRQALLVPVVVDVEAGMMENLDNAKQLLGELGIEIDGFGESQIIVRSVPIFFANQEGYQASLEEMVELALSNPHIPSKELFRDLMARLACSQAVKAGKRMQRAEMESLIRECLEEGVSNCPHGRPIMVSIGREELYNRFFRS